MGSAPKGRANARDESSVKPHFLRLMVFTQPDTILFFSSQGKQPLETAGECGQVGYVPLACQALGATGGHLPPPHPRLGSSIRLWDNISSIATLILSCQ